jgi:putative flippase GtrA
MTISPILEQFNKALRFGLVGLFNTIISISIMTFLAHIGLHYVLYSAIAYLISMSISFVLNLRFTFNTSGQIQKRIVLFFTINFTNLGIVEIIQIILIQHFHVPHVYAVFCGMICYSTFGFIMHQLLSFSTKKMNAPREISTYA